MKRHVIYFVDDDEGIRVSMQALLNFEGYRTQFFASGRELLNQLESLEPGCLVVDFRMPEMSGLQLIREIRDRGVDMPFLLISGCATINIAVEAMKLGAVNIIEKPFEPIDFLAYVQATLLESKRLQEEKAELAERADADPRKLLTPREKQVLELVVAGELTKNIAKTLGISVKTVEVHRSNIAKKFRVDSVAQLITSYLALDPHFLTRHRSDRKTAPDAGTTASAAAIP